MLISRLEMEHSHLYCCIKKPRVLEPQMWFPKSGFIKFSTKSGGWSKSNKATKVCKEEIYYSTQPHKRHLHKLCYFITKADMILSKVTYTAIQKEENANLQSEVEHSHLYCFTI